jgi:hypothetical protein
MVRPVLGIVAAVIVAMALYGVVTFVAETQHLGGDALNGYVQDGHYYVADHGRYTEVTAEQWELSRAHTIRMLVLQPLAVVAFGFLILGFVVPSLVGRPTPEAPDRVRNVIASGPVLATARCRARIGIAKVPVRLAVHPGGIIVRPMWLGDRAIVSGEITAVRRRAGIFVAGVEIEHRGVDLVSPIVLRLGAGNPVATALRGWNPGGFGAAMRGRAP